MATKEQTKLLRMVRQVAARQPAMAARAAQAARPIGGRQLFRLFTAYYREKAEFLRPVVDVLDNCTGSAYRSGLEGLEQRHRRYRERLVRFCLMMARYEGVEGRQQAMRAVELMRLSDHQLAQMVAASWSKA